MDGVISILLFIIASTLVFLVASGCVIIKIIEK